MANALMVAFLFLSQLLGLAVCVTCNEGDKDQPSLAAVKVARGDELEMQSAFLQPVEVHQIEITVQQEQPRVVEPPKTPRHVQEKTKLLAKLSRSKGTWNSDHPRHRLLDTLYGYTRYYQRQKEELDRVQGLYSKVKKKQHQMLETLVHYSARFGQVDRLLKTNQDLCDRIVDNALEFYEIDRSELDKHISHVEGGGKKADKVAVSQSLKHFVRDWSISGGEYERDACFSCLINTLQSLFPDRGSRQDQVQVLLPGAGLGRLGRDIAEQGGFEVTINEWSMYMNVAYRFIETHGHRLDNEFLHPFIESWSHHATMEDMQRRISFPDAAFNASTVLMVEGDFTTAFDTKSGPKFDVIVTYFFIDTARNLVTYLETIEALLKPGGYWINLGPLFYGSAPFVQMSLEEIVIFAEKGLNLRLLDIAGPECGDITLPGTFVRGMEAAYGFNKLALTRNAYNAQFWVAQKSEAGRGG